ncbi:MAG: hypothetical protein AAGJ32_01760 [Pseudomonadota bacterium]
MALGISSLETARLGRDELAGAGDAFWAGMDMAAAAEDGDTIAQRAMARRRYEAARPQLWPMASDIDR